MWSVSELHGTSHQKNTVHAGIYIHAGGDGLWLHDCINSGLSVSLYNYSLCALANNYSFSESTLRRDIADSFGCQYSGIIHVCTIEFGHVLSSHRYLCLMKQPVLKLMVLTW